MPSEQDEKALPIKHLKTPLLSSLVLELAGCTFLKISSAAALDAAATAVMRVTDAKM
jgi:hypothetical protein